MDNSQVGVWRHTTRLFSTLACGLPVLWQFLYISKCNDSCRELLSCALQASRARLAWPMARLLGTSEDGKWKLPEQGLLAAAAALGGGSEGSAVRLSSRCPGAGCCLGQEGREVPDGPRLRQQLLVGWAGLSHDMQRSCRQCLHHDEL